MVDSVRRTMPICFTRDQLKLLEEYAKKKGMLNCEQAVEYIVQNNRT